MPKYPSLSSEQQSRIVELHSKGLTPTQIGKELGLDPERASRRVQGFLLSHGYYSYYRPKPSSQTPTEAPTEKPTDNPPEPTKTVQEVQNNNPEGGEKGMALEEKDLGKIQQLVKTSTEEALKGLVGREEAKTRAKTEEAAKKAQEERLAKTEAKVEDIGTKVDSFCETYPELCKQVKEISSSIEELKKPKEPKPPKPEEHPEKVPIHASAKEYFECKECSGPLIEAQAVIAKENLDFAKRLYEAFKKAGSFDALIELNAKEEEEEKEGDKKEKAGTFI